MTDAPEPSQPDSGVDGGGQPIPSARRPEVGGIPRQPDAVWPETDEAPAAGEAPPEGEPAEGAPAPPAKRTRGQVIRLVLAVVVGVVAVLCIGGAVTGFFVYRKISEPDRSTPGIVVEQYLNATFDTRDETVAARFTCGNPSDIAPVQQTLADVVSREKRFGIHITVGWENFDVRKTNDAAAVGVRLKIDVPEESGGMSESFQQWSFATRHESSGWRVCSGHRVG